MITCGLIFELYVFTIFAAGAETESIPVHPSMICIAENAARTITAVFKTVGILTVDTEGVVMDSFICIEPAA